MEHDGIGWVRRQIGVGDARPAGKPDRDEGPAGVVRTFVGQGADFEGTLRLREAFRIDGEFRGEIVSQTTVIVGAAAGIEANIRAREVVIAGAVVGNVAASRQLTIRSGGRLTGDVETPCLEIAKGAVLNGRTTMVRPELAARAEARALLRNERPRALAGSPAQLADQPRSFPNTSPKQL
jgi:cytoskeletal protein CcmA (bactofilin family)